MATGSDALPGAAAGSSAEAGATLEPSLFSPEQLVLIDRLIAARMAATSDPSTTSSELAASPTSAVSSASGE